jgi:hypothetical protein
MKITLFSIILLFSINGFAVNWKKLSENKSGSSFYEEAKETKVKLGLTKRTDNAVTLSSAYVVKYTDYFATEVYGRIKRDNDHDYDVKLHLAGISSEGNKSLKYGVGQKMGNGTDYTYWLIQPSMKFKLDDNISLSPSIRFRDDINGYDKFDYTFGTTLGYKSYSLGIKKKYAPHGTDYLGVYIGYSF